MKKWIVVFATGFLISCGEDDATKNTLKNEADSSVIAEET